MIRNVLFVCIGNVCRSPMAEALFARTVPDSLTCSAGLHAAVGEAADPHAVELMSAHGLDVSGHRARQLSRWMVREADLIVTMDRDQLQQLAHAYPEARGKLRRLCDDVDVPDPHRCGRRAFRHACGLIERGVEGLAVWLAADLDAIDAGDGRDGREGRDAARACAGPFSPPRSLPEFERPVERSSLFLRP